MREDYGQVFPIKRYLYFLEREKINLRKKRKTLVLLMYLNFKANSFECFTPLHNIYVSLNIFFVNCK